MELDEFKEVWQQQSNGEEAPLTPFIDDLIENKMSSLHQQIQSRDRLEITVCILLILFFGYLFYIGQSYWTRLGSAVIIISSGYIIYMLKSAQQQKIEDPASVDRSVRQHLVHELERVERQRTLLGNIVWWYIAPLTTGLLFITLGWDTTLLYKSIYMICVLLLGVGVWFYNQRVVRKKFTPIKEELEEAIESLEERE